MEFRVKDAINNGRGFTFGIRQACLPRIHSEAFDERQFLPITSGSTMLQ